MGKDSVQLARSVDAIREDQNLPVTEHVASRVRSIELP